MPPSISKSDAFARGGGLWTSISEESTVDIQATLENFLTFSFASLMLFSGQATTWPVQAGGQAGMDNMVAVVNRECPTCQQETYISLAR
eukprot:5518395-Amphidinium_carterae.2